PSPNEPSSSSIAVLMLVGERPGAKSSRGQGSLPAQQKIDDPAAADVGPWPAAVRQEVEVVAAGVFKGVGKDGQIPESPLLVNHLGHPNHRGRQAGTINGYAAERVADDAAE